MRTAYPKPTRFLILLLGIIVLASVFAYYSRGYGATIAPLAIQPTPITTTTSFAPFPSEAPGATCQARGALPDPSCTPGAADPAVTQANLAGTICMSGYTKTVRPPVSYTDKLKALQMQQYGYSDSVRLHEEDHLISLELGGSPTDPKNLWPEPGRSPNPKDKVENALHTAICSGRLTLTEAQYRIATDWTSALQGL